MKKTLVYLLISALFIGCSGPKEPEFVRMENIVPVEKGKLKYTISADIIMKNPNPIGAKLVATDLDILANDVKIGSTSQTKDTDVGADKEFKIPIKCTVSLEEFLADQQGSLSGILNAALSKKVDLTYKGTVTLSVAGVEFDVPVDYEQEMKFK